MSNISSFLKNLAKSSNHVVVIYKTMQNLSTLFIQSSMVLTVREDFLQYLFSKYLYGRLIKTNTSESNTMFFYSN